MRTARPVPAPFGSGSAASQPLRDARRRGGRSTRGFRRSITPEELRTAASYLRSRVWRVHVRGRMQVLDDLLGESGSRGREVKMPSREMQVRNFPRVKSLQDWREPEWVTSSAPANAVIGQAMG